MTGPVASAVRTPPAAGRRRGTSAVELAVAAAVLAAVTATLLPAARRVDRVRAEGDRRRAAAAELSNLLADLSRLPADRLPGAAGADPPALRPAFAENLPGATLTVEATPAAAPGGVPAVRLDGSLGWNTDAGTPARPVRLSAWAFPPEPSRDDETEPGGEADA